MTKMDFHCLAIFGMVLLFSFNVCCNTCIDNRKIFVNKTGVITDGETKYKNIARCEWLIKGEDYETVTVNISKFHMECGYDYLYIHDGASRSDKLLARINGQHSNIMISSTGPMMYFILYSDGHVDDHGFSLSYKITKCPRDCSNSGSCKDGVCFCFGTSYGSFCQYNGCPNRDLTSGICNVTKKKYTCNPGFYGEACSLSSKPNTGLNMWDYVSSGSEFFISRASHVAGYIPSRNVLLAHGGYSLNGLLDDLVMFNFSTNNWTVIQVNEDKPSARSGHSSVVYKNSLIIYGGVLANESLSNELWCFNNLSLSKWTLLSKDPNIPGLEGHTATLVGSIVYIFGGRIDGDLVSSQMLAFNLSSNQWLHLPLPTYAKEFDLRLHSHTACYYEQFHAIIVFGGFHLTSIREITHPTNQMLMYDIASNAWTRLRSIGSNLPPPIALHTAVIAGDYMIIHGGWIETGTKCGTSKRLYFYNLKCHTWVSEKVLTSGHTPNSTAAFRYSHSAVKKDKQTLLFLGGYDRINVLGDLISYKVPKTIVYINETTSMIVYGQHCSLYDNLEKCLEDPACIYCDKDIGYCYPNTPNTSYSCPISSQTTSSECIGICQHMSTCIACATQSSCKWCPLNMKCFNENTALSSCSQNIEGWWGGKSMNFLVNVTQCQVGNKPPGLTYVIYQESENLDYPDDVGIVFSTSFNNRIVAKQKIMFHGFVYPYFRFSRTYDTNFIMTLNGKNIHINLNISIENWNRLQRRVAVLPYSIDWKSIKVDNGQIFPVVSGDERKKLLWYYLKLEGDASLSPQFELRWNHSDITSLSEYFITKSYLQPFYDGNCSKRGSCAGCMIDSSCGWCPVTNKCMLRTDWNMCKTKTLSQVYLTRTYSECALCSHHMTCNSCLQDKFCSWYSTKCGRKNLIGKPVEKIADCPISCENRKNEMECVGLKSQGCMWCTEKQVCIPYSQFAPKNHFGQCHGFHTEKKQMPKECTQFRSCSTCLDHYKCGWCYDQRDPRNGSCYSGDFSGPEVNCSLVFYYASVPFNASNSSWAYNRCPDVDECALGLAKCAQNSTCLNVYGSYQCPCDEGFEGDGKKMCEKTCWPKCDHGTCNMTTYQCKCDLGWKGHNCSIDCGCNGHSTCVNQTGVCDKCQDYTTGEHCEFCVNGSFGNATTLQGCKKCDCHGHGDPSLNYCNQIDGACFCLNNTNGNDCSTCLPGFIGDPKRGICFLPCERANIITNETSGYLSPYNYGGTNYSTCLWVISTVNTTTHGLIYERHVTTNNILLKITKFDASCYDSMLSIYDSVPPNPRTLDVILKSPYENKGKVCGVKKDLYFRSETGTLSVWYKGKSSKLDINEKFESSGFLATYAILSCPDQCPLPYFCKSTAKRDVCTCADGWFGVKCEHEKCPKNCSQSIGQGVCDQKTFQCSCEAGFTGKDCRELTNNKFVMTHVHGVSIGLKNVEIERFAATMTYYENALYVFGGVGSSDNVVLQFDTTLKKWSKLDVVGSVQPSSRYLACSFLYKDAIYLFGGVTNEGVKNELWRLDMLTKSWSYLNTTIKNLPRIAGHSCTLIDDTVFLIGGYHPLDGLHEYITKINMDTLIDDELKFDELEPAGMYGHVAVYDIATKKIYIHGGMTLSNDKIQASNRMFVFDPFNIKWNILDKMLNEVVPALVGHTVQMINDTAYIFGGYYNDFNKDVYAWRISCNHWTKIDRQDWSGNGDSNLMFSSSTRVNKTIYLYGGFNDHISSQVVAVNVARDLCNRHVAKVECLSQRICNWCQDPITNKSSCYEKTAPTYCSLNTSIVENGVSCTYSVQKERACGTFSSCLSCLATHPTGRQTCQWCICTQSCMPKNSQCSCTYKNPVKTRLNECINFYCNTATCRNCNNHCIWTSYFFTLSETVVDHLRLGSSTYNCFPKSLIGQLKSEKDQNNVRNDVASCKPTCSTHQSCSECLRGTGDFAGTPSCLWSEKLSQCLSHTSLAVVCTFGRCGQLYVPSMREQCLKACSMLDHCSGCVKENHCGWCAENDQGKGTCMSGEYSEPYSEKCGVSLTSINEPPVIISNSSSKYTWAYALCPLENECLNGHHDCGEYEDCTDLPNGFSCTCKPGYNSTSINGKVQCLPVCNDGCVNGKCIAPNNCNCSFGWTGKNCSTSCECNQHSHCDDPNICLKCLNNTQGKSCEECKPLYVGDSTNGGVCTPCLKICENNAAVCITKDENASFSQEVKENTTLLKKRLKFGPKDSSDAVCLNCRDNSEGKLCDTCVGGYFRTILKHCIKCMCNGHAFTCNKTTGIGCDCKQNTISDFTCKKNCYQHQCTKCAAKFDGEPVQNYQCYLKVASPFEKAVLSPEKTDFFVVSPDYKNVDIRLIIDVLVGDMDIYLTDSKKIFKVDVSKTNSTHMLRIEPVPSFRRRRSLDNIRRIQASKDLVITYTEYGGGVLHVSDVKKRLIVTVRHNAHNLSNKRFYIALSAINKTTNSQALIYYRQDLPRINLLLFFLVLTVILLLILSGFILGWKIRADYAQQRVMQQQRIQMDTMARRPLAMYKLRCERNEDIETLRRRKRRNRYKLPHITPLAVQNTEDNHAAIVTSMIQFPGNELSPWNIHLASGLCFAQNQHLVHVRTVNQGIQGRPVNTRILNTLT